MAQAVRSWTLGEIAGLIGGEVDGDASLVIRRPLPAGQGGEDGITFAANEKFFRMAMGSGIGAIIVPKETPEVPVPVIRVADPRAAFGVVLSVMQRALPLNEGVHASAVIDELAEVDESARIGANVVVERGAKIGAEVKVYAGCYVGEDCVLGEGSVLYPGVVLYQDVRVGKGAILHAGVVLGADGFGFVWNGKERVKVPQVGGVVLGDEVEVGANSAVDRATCGDTRIGDGTKLDNFVQVAHNVVVGDHVVMAAHVGIGGSTTIGDRVVMGGQAATSDHMTVVDDVVMGGRTGVMTSIEEPGEYFGMPPVPIGQAMRGMALQTRLPDLFSRLKKLERRVKELEGESNGE